MNSNAKRLCKALRSLHVGCAVTTSLLCATLVSAQERELPRDEHAGFSHRELIGASSRGASLLSGAQVGMHASAHGELWFGWQNRVEPMANGDVAFPGELFDSRRGLIASWNGAAIIATSTSESDTRFEWSTEENVRLAFNAAVFDLRFARQVPVSFRDSIWQSSTQRSVIGGGVELPALVEFDVPKNSDVSFDTTGRARIMNVRLHFDAAYVAGDYAGYDLNLAIMLASFDRLTETEMLTVRLFDLSLGEKQSRLPTLGRATDALVYDIGLLSIASSHLHGWSFDVEGGFKYLTPTLTDAARSAGDAGNNPSFGFTMPSGTVRASWANGDDFFVPTESPLSRSAAPHFGTGVAVSLGTFARVDPSGFAVDCGGILGAESRLALAEDFFLTSNLNFAMARRQLIAFDSPALPRQLGDIFPLVRGQLSLEWLANAHVGILASAYAEFSDRDDALMLANIPSFESRAAYGANLVLTLFGAN